MEDMAEEFEEQRDHDERHRKYDRLERLEKVIREAAERLSCMEAAELDGDIPRGQDCGEIARRLIKELED